MRSARAFIPPALTLMLATSAVAWADGPRRFAVLVGNNVGDPSDVELRWAQADAQRLAQVLKDVGGFAPENVVSLVEGQASHVRRVLLELNARIRGLDGPSLLFVFYSGHADAESLHLGRSRLELAELQTLLAGSPAQLRVLVVDACRSGAASRVKGGRPGPDFVVKLDEPLGAEGLVVLTSSAAGEDSQESDTLGASFFTHHLSSALIGAADVNGDGEVTLREAFEYASSRTLTSTLRSRAGPQHPTFRYELAGRGDVVLSRPGWSPAHLGWLRFPAAGHYAVRRGGAEGMVIAEVASSTPDRKLALPPGSYFVVLRAPDLLLEGPVEVRAEAESLVRTSALRRVEYARLVRKGEGERPAAYSLALVGAARSPLLDTGWAGAGALIGRVDLPVLSLELRLGAGASSHENRRVAATTRELVLAAAGLRAFDLGPVVLGAGLELGAMGLWQSFSTPQTPSRRTLAFAFGPLVQVELPLGGRFFGRVELAFLTQLLPSGLDPEDASIHVALTFRGGAGLGVRF